MRNSLILKLTGSFLLVIAIGAGVIYGLTTRSTQNAFRLYVTQNNQMWAAMLAPTFATYYSQTHSWQGVEALIQANPGGLLSGQGNVPGEGMMGGGPQSNHSGMMNIPGQGNVPGEGNVPGQGNVPGEGNVPGQGMMGGGSGQRLILADPAGRVIQDSTGALTGSQLTAGELASGAPITANGQVVGVLIVAPGSQSAGASAASAFLSSVSRSIWVSVLVAAAISLVLVLVLFFQITAPLRQIQKAAAAIARGDLTQRAAVRSKDELGSLAQTFNRMADHLASAEGQRRKLMADVAHELRTPLAVIQANTEGMQDGVLPLDIEQINAIHTETVLLNRLIDDLRLLSLAESGALKLECRPADLGRLLQGAVERFQAQGLQKGVALEVAPAGALPQVSVDADRLNQVLNNLVGNALRYTPPGGKVILAAGPSARNPDEVEVSVTDTGSGIAPPDLPWVFDRFYRADKSRSRASGGSGLGLAIARQLVEAHGGQIRAISPAFGSDGGGYGTRMVFTLPVG